LQDVATLHIRLQNCLFNNVKENDEMKIDWVKMFDGMNLDYLFKSHIELDTSPACVCFERDKIEKLLNKRLEEQLSK